jgi:hypothetical protein
VGHTLAIPAVIAPGALGTPGLTVTAITLAALEPQELLATTVMSPFCAAAPEVTVIELEVPPEFTTHPFGTVHVYEVAFATAAME